MIFYCPELDEIQLCRGMVRAHEPDGRQEWWWSRDPGSLIVFGESYGDWVFIGYID